MLGTLNPLIIQIVWHMLAQKRKLRQLIQETHTDMIITEICLELTKIPHSTRQRALSGRLQTQEHLHTRVMARTYRLLVVGTLEMLRRCNSWLLVRETQELTIVALSTQMTSLSRYSSKNWLQEVLEAFLVCRECSKLWTTITVELLTSRSSGRRSVTSDYQYRQKSVDNSLISSTLIKTEKFHMTNLWEQ